MREQGPLAHQPAPKTGQGRVVADDAVAGDEEGNRIGAHGLGDGAHRPRPAHACGQSPIADDGAERYFAQRPPNALLERGAVRGKRHVKRGPLAAEPGLQLAFGLVQDGVVGIAAQTVGMIAFDRVAGISVRRLTEEPTMQPAAILLAVTHLVIGVITAIAVV